MTIALSPRGSFRTEKFMRSLRLRPRGLSQAASEADGRPSPSVARPIGELVRDRTDDREAQSTLCLLGVDRSLPPGGIETGPVIFDLDRQVAVGDLVPNVDGATRLRV